MSNDTTLLHQYADHQSNDAFATLVRRHINLVYFAALRQTGGDSHRAEDAAQETFLRLSRRASELRNHPTLVGWLHRTACNCAREMTRAELRRANRELATAAPEGSSSPRDAEWIKVRPVIDDALEELPDAHREAVLLRFFEGQSFSQIGAHLNVAENAARMRVSRALDSLQAALSARGVTSTAAALEVVLAIPAAMAAPAHLAPQISTSLTGITAAAATGVATAGILQSITALKVVASAATLAALVASGIAIHQQHRVSTPDREVDAASARGLKAESEIRELQARLAAEKKRADEAESDNDRLLAAVTSLRSQQNPPASTEVADENVTEDSVNSRFDHAKELARRGKMGEALHEFLWCYDIGMRRFASFAGVRQSFLLSAIAELGRTYPPAMDELRKRRDAAQTLFLESTEDRNAVLDFGALNKALGADKQTLQVFESLPPEDSRRQLLGSQVADLLLQSQRYSELVSAQPYSQMKQHFELMRSTTLEMNNAHLRSYVTTSATKNIEALAGAGDLTHAREFIGDLLAFDNSAATRDNLQRRLARAGHSELLQP